MKPRRLKPQWHYGLCLGTFPLPVAKGLQILMKRSPTCNVEIRLRGRGKRRIVKGTRAFDQSLPLDRATEAAIYVQKKKSLATLEKAALVKYKMIGIALRKGGGLIE